MNFLKKIYYSPIFFPVILFLTVFLTYGYQLTQMGFYWDDWELVFLDHLKDPWIYWTYFLYARPFTAWLYPLMEPFLHMDPVCWQFFNIIMRWLIMMGFWWALKLVWPNRKLENGWICLLLAVYPGFTQHSVALTYSRHFVCLALFAFSLGLNLWAIRNPKRFLLATIPAMLFSLVELFTLEYFFGLEILRVFFIFFVLLEKKDRFWRTAFDTLKQYAPYILVLIIFLIFRFVVYPQISPNPGANDPVQIQRLLASPVDESIKFITLIAQDFIHINLFVWISTIIPRVIDFRAKATLFSWLVSGLVSAGLVFLFLRSRKFQDRDETQNDSFIWQALITGILGVLLGGAPVWITGRQSIGGPWADRFSLGPMFGAAVLLVVLVEWFARRRLQKTILLGLVFSLAMSFQLQTVNKYRLSWDNQRDFFWQLAWRAPALEPGTAIIGPGMPFTLVNDLHVGFALNTIYAPDLRSVEAPYWFFRAGGMQNELIPDFKLGYPINYRYLNVVFSGSTSNSLVVSYNSGADCLKIARPDDGKYIVYSNDMGKQVKLSNLNQIITDPDRTLTPPVDIFGEEPPHTWCYYYQKADLARQTGDWENVVRQWQTASKNGYRPANLVEYIPFVEGLAMTGDWETAYQISKSAGQDSEGMAATYCKLWRDLGEGTEDSLERNILHEKLQIDLECSVNAPQG
ncbi:MAG: hypothetical protein AB9891_11210 [Anaerolineaceae bacterium]